MHILELQASNVKRIKAVTIHADGKPVVLGGKNRQGKSSALDAVLYALGGKRRIPAGVVRDGEESATVVLKISADPANGVHAPLIVTRKIRADGKAELEIKTDDALGSVATSPQGIADDLLGPISFDPTALLTMAPAKRLELAREIVGLDFTKQDAERKRLYDERTLVNRQAKDAETNARQVAIPEGTPAVEVSLADLLAEREKAVATNQANNTERETVKGLGEDVASAGDAVVEVAEDLERAKQEVTRLEKALAMAKQDHQANIAAWQAHQTHAETLVDVDLSEIDARIKASETVNANVRLVQKRDGYLADSKTFKEKSDALTKRIEAVDAAKEKSLSAAEWPIAGMGFGDGDITWQGRPFELASQAEQLSVGVALLAAKSPRLKVALIRQGAFLDEESLQAVLDTCEQHGLQPWIERVGKGSECSVIIEEGTVWTPPAEEATKTPEA